ncbi:hypothetical protein [Streptomyces hayashii]|uniref:hypothetical protein n=1 Tax=Streptomyces hayashii TaxID=2839966 RepID=UPI00403CD597
MTMKRSWRSVHVPAGELLENGRHDRVRDEEIVGFPAGGTQALLRPSGHLAQHSPFVADVVVELPDPGVHVVEHRLDAAEGQGVGGQLS